MIVVDIGCARRNEDESIDRLVERFQPRVLFGFDPWDGIPVGRTHHGRTDVIVERKAAATYDGVIPFANLPGRRGIAATTDQGNHSRQAWMDTEYVVEVPCFDLARFLMGLPAHEQVVLKLDVEGAEYELTEHLVNTGVDRLLHLLLVEWHETDDDWGQRRDQRLIRLHCPVEEW